MVREVDTVVDGMRILRGATKVPGFGHGSYGHGTQRKKVGSEVQSAEKSQRMVLAWPVPRARRKARWDYHAKLRSSMLSTFQKAVDSCAIAQEKHVTDPASKGGHQCKVSEHLHVELEPRGRSTGTRQNNERYPSPLIFSFRAFNSALVPSPNLLRAH